MTSWGSENKHNRCTNTNTALLQQAEELQRKSTEVVRRCQQQLNETEELGVHTLDEIRNQNTTMTRIQDSADMTNAKLDHTHTLLNRYDRWAFNWYGRNKRQAHKEGKQARNDMKVVEKQHKEQRRKTDLKKDRVNHYGNNEANRSQLLSSSNEAHTRAIDLLPYDVDRDTFASPLDEETKEHLRNIEEQDDGLDSMLDDMAESLHRLSKISKTIDGDVKRGNQHLDHVIKKVDQVNHKQFVAQSRLRRNLNK